MSFEFSGKIGIFNLNEEAEETTPPPNEVNGRGEKSRPWLEIGAARLFNRSPRFDLLPKVSRKVYTSGNSAGDVAV